MRKWYEMEACNQGPIIGGQVYLVRNIMGYPFEAKMNEEHFWDDPKAAQNDGSRVLCGT